MASTEEVFQAAEARAASIRAAAERLVKAGHHHPDDRYPVIAGALTAWVEQLCIEVAQRDLEIERLRASVHDGKAGQQPQPLAVGGQVGPVHGQRATVEVYALGAGVTIARDRADLVVREGALELEANGQVLVLDPLSTRVTDGLVVPIEGYVAAVGQSVEAVDEAQGGDGIGAVVGHGDGDGDGHAVILSLPRGSGKTLVGRKLASMLGLRWVVDPWLPGQPLVRDALHLTDAEV